MEDFVLSPTVSVVLPTYNRERTIRRAITSVLSQSDVTLELIVVDDASTDNTVQVIEDLLADDRVRLVRNEKTCGGAAARTRGLELATGPFIAFQDSDDEWLADKLALQVADLVDRAHSYAGNYTSFIRVAKGSAEHLPNAAAINSGRTLFSSLIRKNFITTQSLLIRRQVIDEIGGFDEDLPRFQDWDLVLRIASRWDLAFIDTPTVILFDTPGNLTSFALKDIPARQRILAKWEEHEALTTEVRAQHEHIMARILSGNGRPREAVLHAAKAWAMRPQSIRYLGSLLVAEVARIGAK
jgi:glycosyltransferase involved in cell wall biosynthesis